MELFDANTLMLWRALERLLALLVAAASIYLGYRLFWSVREFRQDGAGRIELPGGISLYVTRVGPGVFFALFGTAIVLLSVTRPLTLQLHPAAAAAAAAAAGDATGKTPAPAVEASYFAAGGDALLSDPARQAMLRDLDALKGLEPLLERALQEGRATLPGQDANRRLVALSHARAALLLQHWDRAAFGPPAGFVEWLQRGDPRQPPASLALPARWYLGEAPP